MLHKLDKVIILIKNNELHLKNDVGFRKCRSKTKIMIK